MAFPVVKLLSLAVRQLSRPVTSRVKVYAASHPKFRKYLSIPGQLYHKWETNSKLRLLGLGKAKEVPPLSEEAAAAQGAELLSEVFIFTIPFGLLLFEWSRQLRNDQAKEAFQNFRMDTLSNSMNEMTVKLDTLEGRVICLQVELEEQKKKTDKLK